MNTQDLCEQFTKEDSADACTWYMRLLTAGIYSQLLILLLIIILIIVLLFRIRYLKTHHERFYPFINMDDYYYVDMNGKLLFILFFEIYIYHLFSFPFLF